MINTYLGRLVYDVKVTTLENGKKVLNNRLAMKVGKDLTTFIDIVAWEGTAEFIEKYYKKGFEILLQGELINKKGLKENVEYDTVAILVDKVIFTYGNPREVDVPDFLNG